jgi:G:T/U-mismatch repair DNA glycosylase
MPEKPKKEYRYEEKDENPQPNNKFWVGADGAIFRDADPITEEERLEAAHIWDTLTQGKASPGKKVPTSKK